MLASATIANTEEPKNCTRALNSSEADKWKVAMDNKMSPLTVNGFLLILHLTENQ